MQATLLKEQLRADARETQQRADARETQQRADARETQQRADARETLAHSLWHTMKVAVTMRPQKVMERARILFAPAWPVQSPAEAAVPCPLALEL